MSEAQLKLDAKIQAMVSTSQPHRTISRRLFLYDFPSVFVQDSDRGFSILNTICEHFKVPFTSVKIVGSAQTGYSYFSRSDFLPGQSDLDIAIINSALFQQYSAEVYWFTHAYKDLSKFPRKDGISTANPFREYLSCGYFRPDYMPNFQLRADWFQFFNRLSNHHAAVFKDINAGIYLSEVFFEMKQTSLIHENRKGGL